MRPVAKIRNDVLTVELVVRNGGDEAAHSVTPGLRFRDHAKRGPSRPSLAPGQEVRTTLAVPAAGLGRGRWPCRITVDYADANQYPFQALHVLAIDVGGPPPPRVAVTGVEKATLAREGELRVKLKNLSGAEHSAEVRVLVPEGLEVTGEVPPLTLAPWEEKAFSVPLVNRTALAGSNLPVFVAAQYDDAGVHQTVLGQGVVEIVPQRSFLVRWQAFLWAGASLLVVLWGVYVAKRVWRRRV